MESGAQELELNIPEVSLLNNTPNKALKEHAVHSFDFQILDNFS